MFKPQVFRASTHPLLSFFPGLLQSIARINAKQLHMPRLQARK